VDAKAWVHEISMGSLTPRLGQETKSGALLTLILVAASLISPSSTASAASQWEPSTGDKAAGGGRGSHLVVSHLKGKNTPLSAYCASG
jgi:hypothetical protein